MSHPKELDPQLGSPQTPLPLMRSESRLADIPQVQGSESKAIALWLIQMMVGQTQDCIPSLSLYLIISQSVSSVAQSCPTLCDPMNRSTPGLPVHHQLPEFTQTHVHRVSDAIQPLILCCPLLLLPPIPPSIRVFPNESTLRMRLPKYWSFSFSIIPSKEIPGLIFFRMDWLDILASYRTFFQSLDNPGGEHHCWGLLLLLSLFSRVQLCVTP